MRIETNEYGITYVYPHENKSDQLVILPPDGYIMFRDGYSTPREAREIAAALIKAAEIAEAKEGGNE